MAPCDVTRRALYFTYITPSIQAHPLTAALVLPLSKHTILGKDEELFTTHKTNNYFNPRILKICTCATFQTLYFCYVALIHLLEKVNAPMH